MTDQVASTFNRMLFGLLLSHVKYIYIYIYIYIYNIYIYVYIYYACITMYFVNVDKKINRWRDGCFCNKPCIVDVTVKN